MMRRFLAAILMAALFAGTAAPSFAGDKNKDKNKKAPLAPPAADDAQKSKSDKIVDAIFYQEAKLVEDMHNYTPIVETYIQNLKHDDELGEVPASDARSEEHTFELQSHSFI